MTEETPKPPRKVESPEAKAARKAAAAERALALAKKQKQVLDLRLRGATFRQIADQVGYANPGAAYKVYAAQMAAIPREVAAELRSTELERFDILSRKLWERFGNGDISVVKALLDISDRRVRLTGLLQVEPEAPHEGIKQALGGFLMDAIARERELEQQAALGDQGGVTGIESD